MRIAYIIGGLFVTLLLAWMGWGIYGYFFDTTQPAIMLIGVEDNNYYAGDILCRASCNKSGELNIFLDDQPLIVTKSRSHEFPFPIPTKSIANGKHRLRLEFADNSFHRNKAVIDRAFYADNLPLQAALVRSEAEYKVLQGRTLHVQFQVNKEIDHAVVHALANSYPCFPESKNSLIYECFIPIPCEEMPNEYLLNIEIVDLVGNVLTLESKFQIVLYPFKKQNLTVAAPKVKQEKELGAPQTEFEEAIERITRDSIKEKLWRGPFCLPMDMQRMTCEFGTIRTTQEKGRYMHKGVDIINIPRSVVWATQDGIVALKGRFDMSGNSCVIDHGMGILTLYFHLDGFADIEVGQKICKGNPVGFEGDSGYATGYHLHWEMRVNNVQIDPMQWTKPIF